MAPVMRGPSDYVLNGLGYVFGEFLDGQLFRSLLHFLLFGDCCAFIIRRRIPAT